jgi:hypothetical protein
MKKMIFLIALGLLVQVTPAKAGYPRSGGSAVAIGLLSAIGIDPLGLGLGGSSSTAPSPKTSKDQSSLQSEFKTLASLPGSFDLLNQSAGGSLTTPEIIK